MSIKPFNSQDLTVHFPIQLQHISLKISYENLVLDQDNNLFQINLSILINCLLNNLWITMGEVTCWSLLRV